MTAGLAKAVRALEPGVRLAGKLTLLRCLAEGGMGVVWLARNEATNAKVAVKILHPGKHRDDHVEARFRHEARLGATLSHRNITRVFDLIEDDDGTLVLVMELLRGETLSSYYRSRGSLSTREAVAIMSCVLAALQHAHDRKVVHRDLKPTNIFLHVDPDGQVTPKLLDFGIAKARDSSIETRTGDALGTPSYMSPEQVRALELDGRSDLFSVAVVLYEIIAGENPFTGPTPTAVLAQVLELEIDPDPKIEPRVWLEIQRSLQKQSYQRHASANELATALSAAVGETPQALLQSLRTEIVPVSTGDLTTETGFIDPEPSDASRLPIRTVPGGRTLIATVTAALAIAFAIIFRSWSSPSDEAAPKLAPSAGPLAASTTSAAGSTSPPDVTADVTAAATTVQDAGSPSRLATTRPPAPVRSAPPKGEPIPTGRTTPTSTKSLARTPGF